MSVTVSKLEARVGGSFRFDVEDGSSIVGIYLHILPSEKLVFTWSGRATQGRETIVTLDFLDQGPVTEVVLTHEGLSTSEMCALVALSLQSARSRQSRKVESEAPLNLQIDI